MPVSCPICKKQFDTAKGVSIHYGKMHDISETRSTDTDRSTSKRTKASGSQVKGRTVEDDRGFSKSRNKDGHAGSAAKATSKWHKDDEAFSTNPNKHLHANKHDKEGVKKDKGKYEEFGKSKQKSSPAGACGGKTFEADSGISSVSSRRSYEDAGQCRQKSASVRDGKSFEGQVVDITVFCHICRKPCKNEKGLSIHVGRKHGDIPQDKYKEIERFKQSTTFHSSHTTEADSGISSVSSSRSARMRLREDVDSIRLTRTDVSTASEVVNDFIDQFKAKLTETSSLTFDLLRSGSYYDKTKNSAPDEFDYMFYPRSVCVKAKFRAAPPGYCKLEILAIPDDLKYRVESGTYLDPRKYKNYVFSIFDRILADKSFKPGRKVSKKERPGDSPAYTVLYKAIPGKVLDIDLVPCIQIDNWPHVARAINPTWTKDDKMIADCMKCYHVVCKTCPDDIPGADMMWRMSFSWAEKILIKFANMGNEKSCRKSIFRCLKAVLEDTKTKHPDKIHKFCSYHLKMFMLMQFDDPKYQCGDADEVTLTLHAIQQLKTALREDEHHGFPKIMNYFIPSDNVIRAVPKRELELVRKGLQTKYDYLQQKR